MVGDWMGRMPIGLAVIRSAHRFLKADRKAGLVAAVSARALMVLKAIFVSLARDEAPFEQRQLPLAVDQPHGRDRCRGRYVVARFPDSAFLEFSGELGQEQVEFRSESEASAHAGHHSSHARQNRAGAEIPHLLRIEWRACKKR